MCVSVTRTPPPLELVILIVSVSVGATPLNQKKTQFE